MGTGTSSTRVWQCVPPPLTKTMTRVNYTKPLTTGTSILCQCFLPYYTCYSDVRKFCYIR